MADVERIAPPVPTLPPPVGRSVGEKSQRRAPREPPARREPAKTQRDPPSEHIDEYV
jgi:hypothetical protein